MRCGSAPSIADAVVFSYVAQAAAVGDIFGLMANLNAATLTMEDA
jgi:hypothetical protein